MFHSYNKNKNLFKYVVLFVLCIAIIFGGVFFTKEYLHAQYKDPDSYMSVLQGGGAQNAVTTDDPGEAARDAAEAKKNDWKEKLKAAAGAAFKNALGYFLNTLAIDTATFLASGDEGQKPLFYTEGWGEYLKREADNAAGHFIEGVANGMGWQGMCTPSFDFRVGLSLGLKQIQKPLPPNCKFTTMMKNWEQAANKGMDYMKDPAKFLDGMNSYFSPNENNLAVGLSMYSNFYSKQLGDVAAKLRDRQEGGGIKAVRDPVTGEIKTPSAIVEQVSGVPFSNLTKKEATYIESIYGVGVNAIDTFTTTLAGKFLERMMKKGLVPSGQNKEKRYDWSKIEALTSPTASPERSGSQEARAEFASSFAPSFAIGDPSANKVDVGTFLLDDGVINAKLKTAIDRKLTVRDAIDQGLLQMDGPGSTFAYSSADKQPDSNEGISYNSTFILRKYRIIPVGWEIAASYIRANFQQKIYSLGDIIRGYDDLSSPFFHLIDKNWVLKSPETYCRIAGAGEKLNIDDWSTEKLYDSKKGEYDFNKHVVSREPYCADSKSCISQDDKGNCLYYGYCTEEKSLWRFDSNACPAYYNTCQKFTDSKDAQATYLANTLQSENCSVSNVGCQWFCQDYNPYNNVWTCLGSGERAIKPCDKPEGCEVVDTETGETCKIELGRVSCTVPGCKPEANIVLNPGFEKAGAAADLASSWVRVTPDTFSAIKRVNGLGQKVNSGTYSLSIAYYGGLINELKAKSSPISINPKAPTTYVLSGKMYNGLTYGNAKIAILDAADNIVAAPDGCVTNTDMAKGQWVDVNCTFSAQAVQTTFAVGIIVENGAIPPVGTSWFDDITVHTACPQRDITIYMNAEQDVNESKIYFDKDVKECDAANAGCNEFIRTKEGLGTNLITNSSFEDWEDGQAPRGWTKTAAALPEKITEKAPQGNNFLRFSGNTVRHDIIQSIDPNGIYILSLYAKNSQEGTASQISAKMEYKRIVAGAEAAATKDITFSTNATISLNTNGAWTRFISDPIDGALMLGFNYQISITANVQSGSAPSSDIDAVMLERVDRGINTATSYKDYGKTNAVFLKKPPEYLECTGDPEIDHTSCSKYALMCGKEEVGCESYESANGDPSVPGIISAYDKCPKECVGYQPYKQSATYFEGEKVDNFFIADKAKQCSSTNVGCEEFTNLDKVARGGEGREYFTYIRQCQKPNDSCKSFYTWIGSDIAGYQLKVYSLLDAANNGIPDEIPTPRTDLGRCAVYDTQTLPTTEATCVGGVNIWVDGACWDSTTFNAAVSAQNAIDNPNCREFYSERGGIGTPQYAIVQNTISCTEECFPYRLTNSTQTDCENSGGYWGVCGQDTDGNLSTIEGSLTAADCSARGGIMLIGSSECYTTEAQCPQLANTRTWVSRSQCFYQSVPSEGETCSAAEAGCREYRGTASGNVRVAFSDDFESGTTEKWTYGELSSDALAVGGHSLKSEAVGVNQVIQTQVQAGLQACTRANYTIDCSDSQKINCFNLKTNSCVGPNESCIMGAGDTTCSSLYNKIIPDKSYILTFWAKIARVDDISIILVKNGEEIPIIGAMRVDPEWREYTLGPFTFDSPYSSNIYVRFLENTDNSGAYPFYIDFITIKQIEEYEYRIKNSWTIPISCDTNPYLNPATAPPPPNAPQFMLGCQEYNNGDGKTLYLKSFDKLCREAAVGCEKLIDTRNSNSPFKETFNEKYDISRVDIPDDGVTYVVNSPKGECSAESKGCTAVGDPQLNTNDDPQGYSTRYLLNDPEQYSQGLCSEQGLGCQEFVSEQEGLVYFKDPKSRTCDYRLVPGTSSYGWFKAGSKANFPDCPTAPDILGVNQPAKSCLGGTTPGKFCTQDEECSGSGRCSNWTGLCTNEFVSCNTYVDPVSSISNNVLPNGNLESYYTVCEKSPVPCTPEGNQCPNNEKCGPDTKVYLWNVDPTKVSHRNIGGAGNSSALQITALNGVISQIIDLEEGKLYTVSVQAKNTSNNARIEIQGQGTGMFSQFDNSLTINPSNLVTLLLVNEKDDYKIFAGRFFVAKRVLGATISIKADLGWFDNIELKKTGTYYYLSDKVDFKSCNGSVNNEIGCVLFNDLSQKLLTYNSVETLKDKPPARCGVSGCDSNILLKVRPDRDCGKWLECVTGREQMNFRTGKRDTFCQQIALCDSLNPANGQCNNFPPVTQTPQEFNVGNIDLMKNFTGYSKVGFSWGNVKTEGLYPYAAMQQKKVCVKPSDKFGIDCIEDEDCQTNALAHDGECQPVLKVQDKKDIYESCRMYPEGGSPRWGRVGPVDTGDKPAVNNIVDINNPIAALGSVTESALSTASECSYYKDLNLFTGMKGFCVEKDPRSSYLCLNWLPVDEITGGWLGMTGWVENLRNDVFYCASGAVLERRKLWTKTTDTIDPDVKCAEGFTCPTGYIAKRSERTVWEGFEKQKRCYFTCTPDYSDYKMTWNNFEWFDYREKFDNAGNFTKKHIVYCNQWGCGGGTVIYSPEEDDPKGYLMACDAVTKVTDSDGTNKGWMRRLEVIPDYRGAGYLAPTYNFTIDTKFRPFGSVNSKWAGDPSSWQYILDFIDASKVDRAYSWADTNSNNGQLYNDIFSFKDPVPYTTTYLGGQERMKRLFAQSFGNWQWNGSTYQSVPDIQSRCVGGKNNGTDCTGNSAICTDTASTCSAPGVCEYYSTNSSIAPIMLDNISCSDDPNIVMDTDPATPELPGTCLTNDKVFCATGMCIGADPITSSYAPCSAIGAACTIGGETCQDKNDFCSGGIYVSKACTVTADCLPNDQRARCVGKCSANSAMSGRDCRSTNECRVSGQCAPFSYWIPPQLPCPNNIRSNYFTETPLDPTDPLKPNPSDPLAPGDWCGVTPQVYNITIENATGNTFNLCNGSGNVTLKFNVKINEDQMPMRYLMVDWGDGTPVTQTSSKFGLRDKSDIRDPFIFPHVYTYKAGSSNIYTITIKVKDNWDWCACSLPQAQCKRSDCDINDDPTTPQLEDAASRITVNTQIQVYEGNCP